MTKKRKSKPRSAEQLARYSAQRRERYRTNAEFRERTKIVHAEYYQAHKEHFAKKNAAYRLANKERMAEYMREWQRKNPEKVKARNDKWTAKNRDKVNARTARWVRANPHKRRAKEHNRRVRKRSGGKLSPNIELKLMKAQRGKCVCCKKSLKDERHLDHIMPLSLGGLNVDANIQLLCPPCNLRKNAKHPIDFMQSMGLLL